MNRQSENGAGHFRLPLRLVIFCQRRRFAAYHEQGQAPAPRRSSTIYSFTLSKLKGSLKTGFPFQAA